MTISERIFMLIEREQITQSEFCRRVGLRPSTVSEWKKLHGKLLKWKQ